MRKLFLASIACVLVFSFPLTKVATAQDTSPPASDSDVTNDAATDSNAVKADAAPTELPPIQIDPSGVAPSTVRHFSLVNPFGVEPGGLKVGPFHMMEVTTTGFYESASSPSGQSQSIWGSLFATNLFYSKVMGKGTLNITGQPQVSLIADRAYINASTGADFSYLLTNRWTLHAGAEFGVFQNNGLLQNPQYLLNYVNGGYVVQSLYAQTLGTNIYESTNISATYQMSGRTQISLTPVVGVTVQDQFGVWQFVTNLGFGFSVAHTINPNRSVSVFYNFTHSGSSNETATAGVSSWNTQSIGAGIQQKIGNSWAISANLAASYQFTAYGGWTPSGNIAISKAFRNGNLSVGYSRSEASQVLVSSGFFDQADLSYSRHFGRKMVLGVGAGAFRGINTGSHEQGARAGANFSYQWLHNVVLIAGYNYMQQRGNQATLFNGNTNYVNFGLTWLLGRTAGR